MKQTIISFQITQEEKETLEEVFYLEPWLEDVIDHRRRKGNKYQIKLVDDDFYDCLSALEYQAQIKPTEGDKYIALSKKIEWYSCLSKMVNKCDRFSPSN